MPVTSARLTLDQFLALPEEKPYLEYFDGVITQKAFANLRHSALQVMLAESIDQCADRTGTAMVFIELLTVFGGSALVPDIAVFRRDRVPRDASGQIDDDVVEAPDIAIEIVSPEDGVNALVRRCVWYVANGVQVTLLVDPSDSSVVAFRPGGKIDSWHGGDRIDLSEILPDFDLTVEQLFESLH